MVDIHSHVLPMVDDGSSSIEESLKMIKECIDQGITDVIFTPHYRDKFNKTPQQLKDAFNEFKNIVLQNGLKINLYLGQEIFYTKDYKHNIVNGEVLTLNQTKYLLLEPDYMECEITEAVYELTRLGYIPIIAHVERFPYITIQDVIEIKELGGLIQVNAGAIFCKDFRIDRKTVKKLFKMGLVDFVASDIHSNRENEMLKAYTYVKKKYGIDYADQVFTTNAQKIIQG